MEIFVETLTGKTITIDTDLCATSLTNRDGIYSLHDEEGIPFGDVRLIYAGK